MSESKAFVLPSADARPGKDPNQQQFLAFTPESDHSVVSSTPSNTDPNAPIVRQTAVMLWNLKSHTFEDATPKPFANLPSGFAFSSDGKWLATQNAASAIPSATTAPNYNVLIWHWPEAKQPVRSLDVGTLVNKISFSSDGRFLLTAGGDLLVRVWDLSTGEEVGRVSTLRPLMAMGFTPDHRQIITFDRYSTTTSYWRADDLMRETCQRIGRSLTDQEWKKYLPAEPYIATCGAYLSQR